MCQKQNNITFRRSPQLALQADCWTGYLSLARTKPLSNHTNRAKSERIAELQRLGLQPIMQELERRQCTEEEALKREAYWIRRLLDAGMALTNVLSTRTGDEVKATYYITPEDDMKLERIRLARRGKGNKIDKSALIREAIDLLQE
jgi:hypothetical protein